LGLFDDIETAVDSVERGKREGTETCSHTRIMFQFREGGANFESALSTFSNGAGEGDVLTTCRGIPPKREFGHRSTRRGRLANPITPEHENSETKRNTSPFSGRNVRQPPEKKKRVSSKYPP